MLITFEGIDGSGKSTQISLLKDHLSKSGKEVQVLREPGGTDISELIRGMLLNPEIEIDPVTELLLFSSARSQLIAEKVKPLLAEGVVVILDRFYDSTTAYQGYGRKSIPIDQVHQINKIASHEIAPDVTFYLRLSLEESAKRTAHMQKDRMEQSGIEFFQNVIKGFDELSKSEDRFVTIDASKNVDEVHDLILSKLPF
ncbi:dTMP kinase [Balneola sp. EhC07]|uniref:dTMP kinase n=1 Tax=Balneola sp. EhC07 TaxID=1849360 RepID=UPI0007F377E9|nr:dTMP kinase [Balneola sp. EhC07]OAN64239.1 dTMP kinase [Balneola sp. EhC07]